MTDISKFNGPFHAFVGLGQIMAGSGFALIPLALKDQEPVGINIPLDDLRKLTGALVALQTDLERRSGPQVGYRSVSAMPLASAEAKPTIEGDGSNGVALLLVAQSKQPFVFGMPPALASALATQLEQSSKEAKEAGATKPS